MANLYVKNGRGMEFAESNAGGYVDFMYTCFIHIATRTAVDVT